MKSAINATHYDYLPAYPDRKKRRERVVNVIVETPKGSCQKYALAPQFGIIAFHSVLPKKLEWPYDYGFVPQTLAPDGDGLDMLIINEHGLFSGCLIAIRVIGAIRETKDGMENDRLIGVPLPSKGAPLATDDYRDIADVPKGELERIKSFLVEYSSFQGHKIVIRAIIGAAEAMGRLKVASKKFKKKKS
ncbi:MAG: inorganic diphosphatase [Candidatus Eremiobacteraeota bacterium]|nr:inorganic diphosphatase [Candidatus Eremiobacteraeota bacterium]